MSREDLMRAVRTFVDLEHRGRAEQTAALLPEDLGVADLLRAADGAHQLARALAARRRDADAEREHAAGYDPHDVGSLYS